MELRSFQYLEILSLVISILLIPKLKKTHYFLFLPYLLIVVFVDIISHYVIPKSNIGNHWLFNMYLPIQYSFFSYLHYKAILNKKIIFFGSVLFSFFFLLNLLWVQGFWVFNNNTLIFSGILMIIYSGTFFFELLRRNTTDNILKKPMFWVSSATLIFFTGFSALFSVFFFYKTSLEAYQAHKQLYLFISQYVNMIHYLFLSISIVLVQQEDI